VTPLPDAAHDKLVSATGSVNSVESQVATKRRERKRADAAARQRLHPLRRTAEMHEKEAGGLRDKLDTVRERFGDNQLYSSDAKDRLANLLRQESDLTTALARAEECWLAAIDALETAKRADLAD